MAATRAAWSLVVVAAAATIITAARSSMAVSRAVRIRALDNDLVIIAMVMMDKKRKELHNC